ncbi:hypothetical protein AC249_AIPGENE18676 [Exaiptasia diaphana]|nr:hypothetical protein AC249_AIPGENE18676 [Exaiptasia diaphana]
MKLRSGKILFPVNFKHKQVLGEKHTEMGRKVLQLEIDPQRMKELKTFFSSFFYHCCKNIGYKEWLDELERSKEGGRTIIRSAVYSRNFAVGSLPDYYFKIAETQERFTSPERDPKKAFFLHRKLEVPM